MYEPALSGGIGYARYRFGYTSKISGREGTRVVFTGIGRFRFYGELIAHYTEIFDPGIGMAQFGFDGERIAKRARRSAEALRREPEMAPFLAGAREAISD